jgi:hypothetical protein
MVSGRGLDLWSKIPGLSGLVGVGRILRANREARSAYAQMLDSAAFQNPIAWTDAGLDDVDALLLPGGHRARGRDVPEDRRADARLRASRRRRRP